MRKRLKFGIASLLICLSCLSECILARAAEEAKKPNWTIKELITEVSRHPWAGISNLSGAELDVPVHAREIDEHYTPNAADEPALVAALNDKNFDLPGRMCIAVCLLKLNNEKARIFMEQEFTKSGAGANRSELIAAMRWHLGKGADSWAIALLLAVLKDKRFENHRTTICGAFAGIDEADVREALLNQLKDDPENSGAAYVLCDLKVDAGYQFLLKRAEEDLKTYHRNPNNFPHEAHGFAQHLVSKKRPEIIPFLIRHLDEPYWPAELLVESKDPRALPALQSYLQVHPEAGRNNYIPIAIARLESNSPTELADRLCKFLDDPQWTTMREDMMQLLGRDGEKSIIPTVTALLKRTGSLSEMLFCLSALRRVSNADAELARALADALGRDFIEQREDFKGIEPKPYNLRHEIMDVMKSRFNQNFGHDIEKWKAWVKKTYPEPTAVPK